MISSVDATWRPTGIVATNAVAPLSERADAALAAEDGGDSQSTADALDKMMRSFAVQQFLEATMFGDPEETGLPTLSFDGESDD